jgi:hypothetical protein
MYLRRNTERPARPEDASRYQTLRIHRKSFSQESLGAIASPCSDHQRESSAESRIGTISKTDLCTPAIATLFAAIACHVGRIWRKTGSNVAHLPLLLGSGLRLSSRKTQRFLNEV